MFIEIKAKYYFLNTVTGTIDEKEFVDDKQDRYNINIGNAFTDREGAEWYQKHLELITKFAIFGKDPRMKGNKINFHVHDNIGLLFYEFEDDDDDDDIINSITISNADNLCFELSQLMISNKEYGNKIIEEIGEDNIKKYIFGIEDVRDLSSEEEGLYCLFDPHDIERLKYYNVERGKC